MRNYRDVLRNYYIEKHMSREEGISAAHEALRLSKHKLAGVVPMKVLSELDNVSEEFEINTDLRLAHFLAQCAHESMEFKVVRENLNYSSEALRKIFGKYFPNHDEGLYHRQPERIANRVYANRMENGDEASGDGWRFRGSGYVQLTGRQNYRLFGEAIGKDIVGNPDWVADKYPLLSAAWFFDSNGITKIADEGATDEVVKKITRRVNGGLIGINHRIDIFNKYIKLLIS